MPVNFIKKNYPTIIITVLIFIYICAKTVTGLGYRYIELDSGIKYFGKVDSVGYPTIGRIFYPDGNRGKIDTSKNKIVYRDNSVYTGELSGIERHGNGKMEYPLQPNSCA